MRVFPVAFHNSVRAAGTRTVALLGAFLLTACAETDPYEAAGIDYKLPRTDAKVTLVLDVKQCVNQLGANEVRLDTSLKIDPVAGAQDQVYHLSGKDLLIAATKRSITVDVDGNGVISGVNSTATDQTAAILGDLVKITATAAGAGILNTTGQRVTTFVCKPSTKAYVARANEIESEIQAKILSLATARNPGSVQTDIDKSAALLAAYRAKLHAEPSALFTITKDAEQPSVGVGAGAAAPLKSILAFDAAPLSSLFDSYEFGAGNPPVWTPDVKAEKEDFLQAAAFFVRTPLAPAIGGSIASPPFPCEQYMYVPAGKTVTVVVVPRGQGFILEPHTIPKPVTASMVASQIDEPTRICLSVRFGENRQIALKFDSYGRTLEFTYAPDSRAANAAAALAGAAPDVSTVATTFAGRKLASQKKELDQLQTEQSLIVARNCQKAMDAGATSCPKD